MNRVYEKSLVFAWFFIAVPVLSDSPPGDVVGKLTVGYQGWFGCRGDNSSRNSWIHWITNGQDPPSPGRCKFEIYPDMREYTRRYPTNLANLGNGQPATLFSSQDDQTVDTHFRWMQQYGIDVAALQRFASGAKQNAQYMNQINAIALKVRSKAEKYNRKFYIMYDISGWNNFATELMEDYNLILRQRLNIFTSPAYARQNGRLVICIWGFGVNGRPNNASAALNIINQFKSQGFYVIGGVSRPWRTENVIASQNYKQVFDAFNMISPWSVGTYVDINGAAAYKNTESEDLTYCRSRNIDYQPVISPGFAWSNWNTGTRNQIKRLHGDFMWQQFVNIRQLGITNCYIAMFDEYDEGTAIAKAAEDVSMIPTNQYFLTLDADGVHVSSDFYLRVTRDGAKMMKGQTQLVTKVPTGFQNDNPSNNNGSNRMMLVIAEIFRMLSNFFANLNI